jgi:hypothetical protein
VERPPLPSSTLPPHQDAVASDLLQEEEDEEEEKPFAEDDRTLFQGFTAMPQPGDVLLYALPFCGPVDAMVHFKVSI